MKNFKKVLLIAVIGILITGTVSMKSGKAKAYACNIEGCEITKEHTHKTGIFKNSNKIVNHCKEAVKVMCNNAIKVEKIKAKASSNNKVESTKTKVNNSNSNSSSSFCQVTNCQINSTHNQGSCNKANCDIVTSHSHNDKIHHESQKGNHKESGHHNQ